MRSGKRCFAQVTEQQAYLLFYEVPDWADARNGHDGA
jgi:hypothetical protein